MFLAKYLKSIHLFYNLHFIDEPFGVGIFINDEKNVFAIHHYVSAETRVKVDVAHCSFPLAVEVETNQVTISIQRWATRVSSCGMISRREINWHIACFIFVDTKVFGFIQVYEFLRYIKFIVIRNVFSITPERCV